MQHKTAMLLSGAITAFALMVVVGLVYGSNRLGATAAAATPAPGTLAQVAEASGQSNSAEVANLQAQVQQYRQSLQKAYSDLQAAYDQINALSSAQAQGGGTGRFRGGDRERGFSGQLPFDNQPNNQQNQPFFGQGNDD